MQQQQQQLQQPIKALPVKKAKAKKHIKSKLKSKKKPPVFLRDIGAARATAPAAAIPPKERFQQRLALANVVPVSTPWQQQLPLSSTMPQFPVGVSMTSPVAPVAPIESLPVESPVEPVSDESLDIAPEVGPVAVVEAESEAEADESEE